jgi:hypothetical protein
MMLFRSALVFLVVVGATDLAWAKASKWDEFTTWINLP